MYNDYHLNRVPQHFDSIISPDVVCDMSTDSVLGDESHLYDTLCPINPITGHRDSMLSRLFSGNVSNADTNRMNAVTNRQNANTNAAVGAAQIRGIIAGAIKTAEETSGIKIDNRNKQRIADLTIIGLGLSNDEKANRTYIGSDVRNVMDSGDLEGAAYRVTGRLGWILQNVNPFGGLFKK